MPKIIWNDISEMVGRFFPEFPNSKPPYVLSRFWGCLNRDGVTAYDSEEDRSYVLLHAVALILMLKESWGLAGQQVTFLSFEDIPLVLGIAPSHLTKLYYSSFPVTKRPDLHKTPEGIRDSLLELTDMLRPEISATLRAEHGDDQLVKMLLNPTSRDTAATGIDIEEIELPMGFGSSGSATAVAAFAGTDFHRTPLHKLDQALGNDYRHHH